MTPAEFRAAIDSYRFTASVPPHPDGSADRLDIEQLHVSHATGNREHLPDLAVLELDTAVVPER